MLQLTTAGSSLLGVCMDVDDVTVRCHLEAMEKSGSWADEGMIVASASYLKRDTHVYSYSDEAGASPLVYSASSSKTNAQPIKLAFYLPGHYKSMIRCCQSSLSTADFSYRPPLPI